MKPPFEQQIDRLHKELDALELLLEQKGNARKDQRDAHQDLLQRYWTQSQRVATASRAVDEYESLLEENRRLRSLHQETRQRLQRLLGVAKALAGELRQ